MQNNFFIAFFERSGSTMLVDLLNQHPQIQCRMEIFDTKVIQTKDGPQQVRTLDKTQVQEVLSFFKKNRPFSKIKIKGFKFKYPNQLDKYLDVYTYLLENKFKCIFLLRKNLLKAAISHQYHRIIREKTGVSNIRKDVNVELEGLSTLNAINYMEMRERNNVEFQQKLSADFRQIKMVYYEDLLYKKQETLYEIFQFLEVKRQAVRPSNFKKIVNDDLKKAIQNYDWVHKILSNTLFINYFYKDEINEQDLLETKNKLIQFYKNLDIHLPEIPNKNTYHYKLQKPLNLTEDEVYIFRKLDKYYFDKLNQLNNDLYVGYRKKMFNKIKQLEIKLNFYTSKKNRHTTSSQSK